MELYLLQVQHVQKVPWQLHKSQKFWGETENHHHEQVIIQVKEYFISL